MVLLLVLLKESHFNLETLVSVVKTGLLRTDLVESIPFEPSSLGGKREKIYINRETPERSRSSECPSAHSCFPSVSITRPPNTLCLLSSAGLFSTVLPVAPQLPGDWNQENNVPSCFGCTMTDTLPLHHNSAMIFPDKNPARIES